MARKQELTAQGTFVLAKPELMEGIRENLEGVDIEFPVIKILHSAQFFEMPTGDTEKTFRGIILFHHNCNAWWAESFDASGGGTAPDCSSLDGIAPNMNSEAVQSDFCDTCPQNAWGTEMKDGKPGKGKACKNMKRLYVLCEGDLLPSCLIVSPANKKTIDRYITLVSMKGILLRNIVTEFKLKEESSADGIKFSSPDLLHNLEKNNMELLSQEQTEATAAMRKAYMPMMKSWERIGDEG